MLNFTGFQFIKLKFIEKSINFLRIFLWILSLRIKIKKENIHELFSRKKNKMRKLKNTLIYRDQKII